MKDRHIESKKRLEHILKAIEDLETFVQNETLESFCVNTILNNAVLYNFTIMGEALIHVEAEKLAKYDYPWYKVRAFRNMIAHEYFNIKLPAVWEIIQKDLPELKIVIQNILKTEY
jgi:uncharacterized protein with HEPN domain